MKVFWICLALVVSPALWAQTDSDATDSDTRVATDDDYEEVQKATGVFDPWPRWYLTVGATYLGANGAYSLYVPEVGTIPVLDFDTIGLSKRDASHYLSINWRSQQNRWGL